MATVNGSTIAIFQGETLDIQFPVIDATGVAYSLAGGSAVLSYRQGAEPVVDVDCAINSSTISASFSHEATRIMSGAYNFQLMCKNSDGKIVMVKNGLIRVMQSLNPDAVSEA